MEQSKVTIYFGDLIFEDNYCIVRRIDGHLTVNCEVAEEVAENLIDSGVFDSYVIDGMFDGPIAFNGTTFLPKA